MWNPIAALRDKFTGAKTPETKTKAIPKEVLETTKGSGEPDFKELEKKGMLGKFFRHWKNPAFMKQMKAISARMQAEGVNVKDQSAVKEWISKHQKEIEAGKIDAPSQSAPKTFKNSEPAIGRNSPCSCGSGKKYKKCCGK